MEDKFKIKAMDLEVFNKLFNDPQIRNLVNAVSSDEFIPITNMIEEYSIQQKKYSTQYGNDDVRTMFFAKILNAAYSYQLERIMFNGPLAVDENIKILLKSIAFKPAVNNWESFRISHNYYSSFNFYIRIFSCFESSIRKLIASHTPPQKFEPLGKLCNPYLKNLDPEYEQLVKLLCMIRNLMHTLGVPIKDDEIEYKGKIYKFESGKLPESDVLSLINIIELFRKDVIKFATDLFNVQQFISQKFIEDDFKSDLTDIENILIK